MFMQRPARGHGLARECVKARAANGMRRGRSTMARFEQTDEAPEARSPQAAQGAPSTPSPRRNRRAKLMACAMAATCVIALALGAALNMQGGERPAAGVGAAESDDSAAFPVAASASSGAPHEYAPPAAGQPAPDASEDAAATDLGQRVQLGDDPAAYEPGFVLVEIPDGSTPEQVFSNLMENPALAGASLSASDGGIAKIALPGTISVSEAVDLIEASGAVGAVQPNFRYYIQGDGAHVDPAASSAPLSVAPPTAALGAQSVPNDKYYGEQWYLPSIGAPAAWNSLPASTTTTTVAVIDSAFLTTHEDLKGNVVAAYDAVKKKNSISTKADGGDIDHGTHCAGIVAATANNSKGIAGVTFNRCKVLPVRVADSRGNIYSDSVASAYSYLVSKRRAYNIRVASMSLGAYVDSRVTRATDPIMYDAIQKARDAGIVSVVAACNDEEEVPYRAFPSDFDNVVSVIALAKSSNGDGVARGGYSNYNVGSQKDKDISAPGSSIVSLAGDGASSYDEMDGTSMATPIVAGALGLMFATAPNLTVDEATSKLYSTAKDLTKGSGASAGWDRATGYGEVNVAAALSSGKPYLSGEPKVSVGGTAALSVKVAGAKQSASAWKWNTSDKSVATINAKGTLTGKKSGQVIVTATKGGLVAQQTVTVQVPASSFKVSVGGRTYNGKARTPAPTVTYDGKKLKLNRDYTVSYSGNVNAGTGRVIIRGVEPYYGGTVKKGFKIRKTKLSKATIKLSSAKLSYNGKKQVPVVTVRDIGANKNTVLKKGRDFKVSGGVVSGAGTVKITARKACANFTGSVKKSFKVKAPKVSVYRLYNPNTSEHLFTTSASERKTLKRLGWNDEGVAWKAPKSAGKKVYRLYNPDTHDHHYTSSVKERKALVNRHGWKSEGVCWRSFTPASAGGKKVYRLYNPGAPVGQHLFTTSARERDALVNGYGWISEGVAFRAVS